MNFGHVVSCRVQSPPRGPIPTRMRSSPVGPGIGCAPCAPSRDSLATVDGVLAGGDAPSDVVAKGEGSA